MPQQDPKAILGAAARAKTGEAAPTRQVEAQAAAASQERTAPQAGIDARTVSTATQSTEGAAPQNEPQAADKDSPTKVAQDGTDAEASAEGDTPKAEQGSTDESPADESARLAAAAEADEPPTRRRRTHAQVVRDRHREADAEAREARNDIALPAFDGGKRKSTGEPAITGRVEGSAARGTRYGATVVATGFGQGAARARARGVGGRPYIQPPEDQEVEAGSI